MVFKIFGSLCFGKMLPCSLWVFVGCGVEKVSVWWAVNLSVGGGSDMVEGGGTARTVRAEGQED